MTTEWNAASYDKVADPQAQWGAEVLARLPLDGDEAVLDAGCGTGRVTEQLLERLPRGRVVALDQSVAMLDQARGRLARFGGAVDFIQADLGRPLPVSERVDAILSTATFHWVPDHDALFANLAAVLRPGGRLVAQCGGAGNIAKFIAVAASVDPAFVRNAHNFRRPRRRLSGWSARASRTFELGCHLRQRRSRPPRSWRRSSAPSAFASTWRSCPRRSVRRLSGPWRHGCPSGCSTTCA